MIIALAGRRIDAADAQMPRFPRAMVDEVRQQLRNLFVQHRTTALVCSGACGADLLALDVAGELGLQRRMVLPFARERFRSTSVTDRADPDWWGFLFDRVADDLEPKDLVVLHRRDEESEAYLATNEAILDEASKLARELNEAGASGTGADNILAALVWNEAPRHDQDVTAAFEKSARQRGINVTQIWPPSATDKDAVRRSG